MPEQIEPTTAGQKFVLVTVPTENLSAPNNTSSQLATLHPTNLTVNLAEDVPNADGVEQGGLYEEITLANCIECDKLVDLKKNHHPATDCIIEKDLQCVRCPTRFNHEQNLKVHIIADHSDQSDFVAGRECEFCDSQKRKRPFQRFHAFLSHIRSHAKPDGYRCSVCQEEFEYSALLKRHRRLVHELEVPSASGYSSFVGYCPKCSKLIDLSKVEIHRRTHQVHQTISNKEQKKKASNGPELVSNRRFQCEKCPKSFRRPAELKRHQAVHEDNPRWSCSLCEKKFVHESSLVSHKKTAHSNDAPVHLCPVCGLSFSKACNVERHVKTAHPIDTSTQIFDCPDCPCQFNSARAMKRHISLSHGRRDLLRCNQCFRVFNKKSTLARHMKIHVSGEGRRPFKCNRCDKRFTLRSSLKLHMDVHARRDVGDPVLTDPKCPICLKHLSSQSNLRKHLLIHQNNFECPDCFQRFATIRRLDRHSCMPFPNENSSNADVEMLELPCSSDNTAAPAPQPKSYNCTRCPSSFSSFKLFKEHKSLHLGLRPHLCWTCHKSFRTAQLLSLHREVHNREPIYCEYCHMILLGRGQYAQHVIANHRSEAARSPFFTETDRAIGALSSQSYPDAELTGRELAESLFEGRAQSVDPNAHEPSPLEEWDNANVIVETTLDRRLRCSVCLHEFISVGRLVEHLINVSTEELHSFAVMQCPLCSCSLRGANETAYHLSSAHPYIDPVPSVQESRLSEKAVDTSQKLSENHQPKNRPHRCTECGFSFNKKSDLQRHFRTHTDERPYVCNVCDKAFRVKSTLNTHYKTHSRGLPQEKCTVCDETFYTKNALALHLRIHSGEKPLQCRYCPLSFRSSSDRLAHETSHHEVHNCSGHNCTVCELQKRIRSSIENDSIQVPEELRFSSHPSHRTGAHLGASNSLAEYDTDSMLLPVRKMPSNIVEEQPENVMETIAEFSNIQPGNLPTAEDSAFSSTFKQKKELSRPRPHEFIHITAKRVSASEYSVIVSVKPPNTIRVGVDSTCSVPLPDFQAFASQLTSLRLTLADGQLLSLQSEAVLKALGDDTYVCLRARPRDDLSRCVELLPPEVDEFPNRCDICEVDLPTKQISDDHFASEDHETAQVLHPLSDAVQDTMANLMIPVAIPATRRDEEADYTCKLCGRKYSDMEPLVAHIRRDHERDHPHSFAPRPAARTAPPLERDRLEGHL